jgi:hypothetical protein
MTRCRFTCGEPPTRLSGESQSSHHGFPFGCDSDQGAQHASPYSSTTGRSSQIVDPRQAARPSVAARADRKRSGADGATAFPRAAASDAARSPSRPKAQQRDRVHEQPAMTTSCGRRDKPTHQRATTGSALRRMTGVSQQESKTPSRGSLPFGGVRCADRCALACLPSAFRSQGFSPSQRFHPGTPSWLCFKPHPPLGFMGLQSFSRRGQPWCLSAPVALLSSGAPRQSRTSRLVWMRRHIRSDEPNRRARHTTGGPGSRALLRPGVRHSTRRVNVTQSRCSPGLFLFEAFQPDRWA